MPETQADYVRADASASSKQRNWWIWVSAVLALALIAMLAWNVSLRSDVDDANAKIKDLQAEIDKTKAAGNEAATSYRTAYEDLQSELGTTQEDLAATEQELADAQAAAEQADKDAAAAKQQAEDAQTATDKAQAEAEQAQADAKAANSAVTMTKECANTFLTQVDTVLKSDDPTAAAETAKQELQGIAADCKAALGRS